MSRKNSAKVRALDFDDSEFQLLQEEKLEENVASVYLMSMSSEKYKQNQ